MSKDIGQSVFQRLKNLAKDRKENLDFLLERYAMERLFYKITQWNGFCNRNLKTTSITFETVIEKISDFLMPIIQAIQSNQEFDLDWSAEKQSWNK
ncbi:MAG: hypothetical protein D6711_06525 [Chloroflexi bacterium]|nr:MAG: hypothetical protein D6711_06525 [Chloroflexota bacterium]